MSVASVARRRHRSMSRDATRHRMSNGKIAGEVLSPAMQDGAGCRRMSDAHCARKSIGPAAIFIRGAVEIEDQEISVNASLRGATNR
ncbi:hypothetical protein [Collimonas silvisoli]|uniref:hypothetical protein n=1 Tax=Collimonas silvisoli TaxID=2825884 RepID=UPI001B8D5A8B|nr:hypothetical protein [Collimonas silvisoli]